MRWTIRNGVVRDEEGTVVAMLPDDVDQFNERTIEGAPEAFEAIRSFIEEVNSGTFKPRKVVKEFETLLSRYQL